MLQLIAETAMEPGCALLPLILGFLPAAFQDTDIAARARGVKHSVARCADDI